MHKVKLWLFASILLLFPLLSNATSYEAGFADGVDYEQVSFNTHFADSLNALNGEMEADLFLDDIALGLDGLEPSQMPATALLMHECNDMPCGDNEAYAQPEVGWHRYIF